jgi:hypothetical protein
MIKNRHTALIICLNLMCISVSTTAPLDSNLSEATFGLS